MQPVRKTSALSLSAFIIAMLWALICLVPFSTMQSWGSLIRRSDDFTLERYSRLIQACCFFAAAFLAMSILLWIYSTRVVSFLTELCSGVPEKKTTSPPLPRSLLVLSIAICITGFALRWANLFQPMAYDESYTYINFASRSLPEAIGDYNSTNNHLLNTFCIYVTTRLFGPQEWAIRIAVFTCGCLLPWAVLVWAREWVSPPAALIAGSFTAVAPELITYSVDARGYMYVALAAVVLDLSLHRVKAAPSSRNWCVAWMAMVLGLCAMPIMLYAVVASCAWFLLMPEYRDPENRPVAIRWRLLQIALLWSTAWIAVLLFYTPAYIFRGFQFLRDPIMKSVTFSQFMESLALSWRDAWLWWCDGAFPIAAWILLLLAGVWRAGLTGRFWLRWLMPFAVVFAINLIQQVAPPPRIFLQLAPWMFLLAGVGAVGLKGLDSSRKLKLGAAFSLLILVSGIVEAARRPVLFFPEERSGYASVPDVIRLLKSKIGDDPTSQHVLIAPLPCDLPSIFYMDRNGFRVELNQIPRDGQDVWLIARPQETPDAVLKSRLVHLEQVVGNFENWEVVEKFKQLTLSHAIYRDRKE